MSLQKPPVQSKAFPNIRPIPIAKIRSHAHTLPYSPITAIKKIFRAPAHIVRACIRTVNYSTAPWPAVVGFSCGSLQGRCTRESAQRQCGQKYSAYKCRSANSGDKIYVGQCGRTHPHPLYYAACHAASPTNPDHHTRSLVASLIEAALRGSPQTAHAGHLRTRTRPGPTNSNPVCHSVPPIVYHYIRQN